MYKWLIIRVKPSKQKLIFYYCELKKILNIWRRLKLGKTLLCIYGSVLLSLYIR